MDAARQRWYTTNYTSKQMAIKIFNISLRNFNTWSSCGYYPTYMCSEGKREEMNIEDVAQYFAEYLDRNDPYIRVWVTEIMEFYCFDTPL